MANMAMLFLFIKNCVVSRETFIIFINYNPYEIVV